VKRPLVALVALALLATAAPARAQFTVEGAPYATGEGPYGAYVADFNADGRPDVAVTNGDNAPSISLFLRSAGGFVPEAGSPYAIPANSNGALGDFDGDGRPDLAVADFNGSGLAVALRTPTGFTLEPSPPLGGALSAVGAGDFNRDGRTDLAVAAYDSGNVTVLLRTTGGFTAAGNYFVGTQPRQLAVADVSGDGLLDVAVANRGSNNVTVLRGNGQGAFTAEPAVAVGAQPTGIAAGDFTGDGRVDLAVANFAGDSVTLLARTALGGFTASTVAVPGGPVGVAGGDFDGDGALELAVAVNAGSLDVIDGGVRTSSTPVAAGATGLAVADFNADTRPDVAVTSLGANRLTVLLSPAPPPPPPPPPPPQPPEPTPEPPRVNREVNAEPASGTVRIRLPGTRRFVDLTAGARLPNGTTVDARKGRVTIVAAQNATKLERADFYAGIFRIRQARRLTTLTLTEALDCRRALTAQRRKPKTRKLWGDGKGRFRTKGQYSAATIRGTRWLVQDGCRYTRTRVAQGAVTVRDSVRKRTVVLRRGRSYTARAR